MATEPFVFQPVRGTEETIQGMTTIRDGYLYFAYDTGRIYLDKNGRRYPMGSSSSGISYAHGTSDEIIKVFPDEEDSFEYTFPFAILDDSATVPHADTLILNSEDVSYSRQSDKEVDENQIINITNYFKKLGK